LILYLRMLTRFCSVNTKKTLEAVQSFYVGSIVNVIPVRAVFYDYMQITKQLF